MSERGLSPDGCPPFVTHPCCGTYGCPTHHTSCVRSCSVCDRAYPVGYDRCPSSNQPWHKQREEALYG